MAYLSCLINQYRIKLMTVNNSSTNKFRNESDLKIDLFLISEKKQKETYYNAQKKVYIFQKYIGLVCTQLFQVIF